MNRIYADTSVLVRAYLADEPDNQVALELVFGGGTGVVTSEVTRLEFASAVTRAMRANRNDAVGDYLGAFDADCGSDGPITLLALRPEAVLPSAHRLVTKHGLRSLDALHLAVALDEGRSMSGGALAFATHDTEQASAAAAEGLDVV
ncbi:MAG: type II toxin-antitoxin system VapC family toxin [Actinomycetota bacterium]